jgi:hypothetical protein
MQSRLSPLECDLSLSQSRMWTPFRERRIVPLSCERRTVHNSKTQKHAEEKDFWTPFREQRQTVYAPGPDYPQVKRQKTSGKTATLNSWKLDVRTVREYNSGLSASHAEPRIEHPQ